MGCLYLEIEGQSCLVGSIDQGLMKNSQIDLLNRMTKERARKSILEVFFPMATSPGIFQQITPNKSLQTFWPNYRLSIAMGLSTNPFVIAKSPRNNGWLLTIERDAVFKGLGGGRVDTYRQIFITANRVENACPSLGKIGFIYLFPSAILLIVYSSCLSVSVCRKTVECQEP